MGFVEEVHCDISGSHSGVAEDLSPLGYYAVWTVNSCKTFNGL
jgi:hypothetical protein